MSDRFNKTSISSIVFLDIVGYSEKPGNEQFEIKDRFNTIISAALQDVPKSDCIILDTGDGAAISLLGAPEEALFVSLTIRDGILKDNEAHDKPLLVRIGINLGPVRVVKDINDQPNIIGDGINVAQRVMSFAEPSQILVSRSYYEIVSRLSTEMTEMFSYSGVRADKHVREHEVYAVAQPGVSGESNTHPTHLEKNDSASGADAALHADKTKSSSSKNAVALFGVAILLLLAAGYFALSKKAENPVQPSVLQVQPAKMNETKPPDKIQQTELPATAPETQDAKQKNLVNNATAPTALPKPPRLKKQAPREEAQAQTVEEVPAEDYGPGYLTKDASGQQVILYGDAANEARARDKAKRQAN